MSKRFIHPIATILCACLLGIPAALAQTKSVDLTGQVKNQKGAPVANATVMISSAGPRSGSAVLCPYSYADCGKKAVTDSQGKYEIPKVAPDLKFTVLAMASGHAPAAATTDAPEKGPLNVTLNVRDYSQISPKRQVTGRIFGPDGNPVVAATLEVGGMVQGTTTHFGGLKADDMTLTDETGEYHLAGGEDFDALLVTLDAPGLAKRWVRLEPGKKQLLRMKEGSRVEGRVLLGKKPLAHAAIDMATTERACGEYLKGFHAVTDDQGRFVFEHLPAKMKFDLFGLMDSFKQFQAGLLQNLDTPEDGQTLNLGEIQAQPAHRISGRVILSDGKAVPAGTRMLVDRSEAWDFTQIVLDKEGRFDLSGVPQERIGFMVSIKGYRFSKKNPNLDQNQRGIKGRVVGDISGMDFLMEPGEPVSYQDLDRLSYEEQERRSDLPLRGVPSGSL